MSIAGELTKVAGLILGFGTKVYDIPMPEGVGDIDFPRLKARLLTIINMDLETAKARWLKVEDRWTSESEQFAQDKKAITIAASFLMGRQYYMPVTSKTVERRLRIGPLALTSKQYAGKEPEKWLSELQTMVKKMLVGIDKWHKEQSKGNVIGETKAGNFTVTNTAGLPPEEFSKFVDFIKEGATKIPQQLAYGNVYVTTKKILGPRNKTLAYYRGGDDTMHIISDATDAHPAQSFIHEIGHRAWYKQLNYEIRQAFMHLYMNAIKKGESVSMNDMIKFVLQFYRLQGGNTAAAQAIRNNQEALKKMSEYGEILKKSYEGTAKAVFDFANSINYEKAHMPSMPEVAKLLHDDGPYYFDLALAAGERRTEFRNLIRDKRLELYEKIDGNEMAQDLYSTLGGGNEGVFPTRYSTTDLEEFFAENFMFYITNKPVALPVKELLKKAGY